MKIFPNVSRPCEVEGENFSYKSERNSCGKAVVFINIFTSS